jgi:hypothetical protein
MAIPWLTRLACTSQPLAPPVPISRRAHEIRCGSVGLYRHIGEAARRRLPLKRTNPPPRHRAAAPATMSLAAMFVFLLVSALQTLDSVLDLARKVCVEKILSFSFCSRKYCSLGKERFQFDSIEDFMNG